MRRVVLLSILCVCLCTLNCGVAAEAPGVVKDETGRVVRSIQDYAFEQAAEAPPTVNPSLMDIIEANTGIILVDPRLNIVTP